MLPTYNSHGGKHENTLIALALRQLQRKYTRRWKRLYRRNRSLLIVGLLVAIVLTLIFVVARGTVRFKKFKTS